MRFVQTSAIALSLAASVVVAGSCAGGDADTIGNGDGAVGNPSGMPSSSTTSSMSAVPGTVAPQVLPTPGPTVSSAAPVVSNAPTQSTTTPALSSAAPTTSQTTTTEPTTPGTTEEEDVAPDTTGTAPKPTMTVEMPVEPPVEACTDIAPTDVEEANKDTTCPTWAEWGECENPNNWLDSYCNASCGRCTPTMSSTMPDSSSTDDPGPMMTMMGSTGSGPGGTDLGDDNPYGTVEGGSQGHATRYWDCCKASCGWSGKGPRTVASCDKSDNSIGATDQQNSCEQGGQGGAFTCHRMAPWAHSNQVSYGYAAVNGVGCGTCFQIQFDGTGHYDANDPGSKEISGKTMIVMATNIGNIAQGQFDLLTPGGGVGDFNGCSGQWGVDNSQLGAQYGGFLSDCRQGGADHEAAKQCMRDKCESIFGSRGLTELYDGCMWFVDWFKVADNPNFVYKQLSSCPEELNGKAY